MKLNNILAITLSLVQFPLAAANIDYMLDFGVVIHNDVGEPIGFEKTKQIPIARKGQPSLYGVIVTSPNKNEFLLNSIHILPQENNEEVDAKIIGKSMIIQKRGAILMRTNTEDVPGEYTMEIYIDSKLHHVFNYELVPTPKLAQL